MTSPTFDSIDKGAFLSNASVLEGGARISRYEIYEGQVPESVQPDSGSVDAVVVKEEFFGDTALKVMVVKPDSTEDALANGIARIGIKSEQDLEPEQEVAIVNQELLQIVVEEALDHANVKVAQLDRDRTNVRIAEIRNIGFEPQSSEENPALAYSVAA